MRYVKITEKILFIEAEGRGRYPYSNSMLIDDDVRVLVDTGMGRDLAVEIAKDKKIDLVINSHGHEDHVASNNLFKDAKICSHKFARALSHKGIVLGGKILEEKLSDYLNKIFEREERLLEFLTEERSMDEIINRAIIYGRFAEPKAVFRLFEKTMIEKHLERLIEKNLVAHTSKGFKAVSKSHE